MDIVEIKTLLGYTSPKLFVAMSMNKLPSCTRRWAQDGYYRAILGRFRV